MHIRRARVAREFVLGQPLLDPKAPQTGQGEREYRRPAERTSAPGHGSSTAVWRTAASQDRGRYLGLGSMARLALRGQLLPAQDRGKLKQSWSWTARPGEPATFWRAVTMQRGDVDHDPGQPARALLTRIRQQLGPRRLLEARARAWADRWQASDVVVGGDEQVQRAFRFAAITCSAPPTRRTTGCRSAPAP
jgi:hypothetical protein